MMKPKNSEYYSNITVNEFFIIYWTTTSFSEWKNTINEIFYNIKESFKMMRTSLSTLFWNILDICDQVVSNFQNELKLKKIIQKMIG